MIYACMLQSYIQKLYMFMIMIYEINKKVGLIMFAVTVGYTVYSISKQYRPEMYKECEINMFKKSKEEEVICQIKLTKMFKKYSEIDTKLT